MWDKPDALDRLAQALVGIAALFALGNGLAMLFDPLAWFDWVGTVKATGPANRHFIRDIGLAYLICSVLMAYGAGNLPMRWGAALAGAGWLALHGALHVWEVARGLCAPGIFWTEAPGTLGPPMLALVGIALQTTRQRVAPGPLPIRVFVPLANRMTWRLAPNIADFARAPGHLAEKFAHFLPFTVHRHAASVEQVAMARLGAVMAADCGPCVEIAARGALDQGVPRDTINAALDCAPIPGEGAQAYTFAQAIITSNPEVDALGDAIEVEFGRAVRTELTVAAATAAVHPAFKRGLGYGKSCALHRFRL